MRGVKQLADEVARALVAEGFTVHRYDSASTRSVYLKLDWGACNSIRVSDHPGHPHIRYRYNIGTWVEEAMEVEETYPRFFWPADGASDLVAKCATDRDTRIGWSGQGGYARIVERKKREARRAERGFWTHARKVKAR